MTPNPMRGTLAGGAVVALALFASPCAMAAQTNAASDAAPIVIAQESVPATSTKAAGPVVDEFPAYQRGVRKAAVESPEALRRYTWRTRMIYNFYYNDFAPKE
jgi:hypothetical protein